MRRSFILSFSCILFLAMPFLAAAEQRIAAIVNDDVVSVQDLNDRLGLVLLTSRIPDREQARRRLSQQVLRGLIEEKLQLQEAGRLSIGVAPDELDRALDDIASRNELSVEELRQVLERNDINARTLLDQLRAQISWLKVVNQRIRPQVNVTVDQLEIDHDGRWLLALAREGGRLSIVDLARNRATHVLEFEGKPDRMAMSDDYLYLRETEAARVSILHLATLDADSMPGVQDVAIGARPAGSAEVASSLPTIAALPEGGGALIAHPIDKTLYLYMETGMQAPMNAFRSWTAAPKAVLIHDRSLNETAPGFYETTTLISDPGAYEIVFHLPNPGHVACFPIDVESGEIVTSNTERRQPPTVTTRIDGRVDHGRPVAVTLELQDPSSDDPIAGIDDLKVLVVDRSGGWHWQGFARPIGDHGYAIELTPPKPGVYTLFASAPSVGLTFESQPRLQLMLE